jgi:hypothetical protein
MPQLEETFREINIQENVKFALIRKCSEYFEVSFDNDEINDVNKIDNLINTISSKIILKYIAYTFGIPENRITLDTKFADINMSEEEIIYFLNHLSFELSIYLEPQAFKEFNTIKDLIDYSLNHDFRIEYEKNLPYDSKTGQILVNSDALKIAFQEIIKKVSNEKF